MLVEWKWPWFLAPVGGIFRTLWSWVTSAWIWLADVTPIYRWWYVTLLLSVAVSLIRVTISLIRAHRNQAQPIPQHYGQDTILGLPWRWVYRDANLSINMNSLSAFCSTCDRTLEWSNAEVEDIAVTGVFGYYMCREHGSIASISQPYNQFRLIVVDEILLKLRNGNWRQVVEQQLQASDAKSA